MQFIIADIASLLCFGAIALGHVTLGWKLETDYLMLSKGQWVRTYLPAYSVSKRDIRNPRHGSQPPCPRPMAELSFADQHLNKAPRF